MQALSAAVGRSLEETALLIHLVLKEIAYRDSPKGTYLVQYCMPFICMVFKQIQMIQVTHYAKL